MAPSLVTYPDERLTQIARPITDVDESVQSLIRSLGKHMKAHDGVGIAAPQLGYPLQLFLVSTRDPGRPQVFINPEIVSRSQEAVIAAEGCLSFPGYIFPVARSKAIRVRALNEEGKPFEIEATGFYARVIQHEYDHLVGKLLIDQAIIEFEEAVGS